MENGALFYVCVSAWCFMPVILFVVGLEIGRGKWRLPFRVKIEKTEEKPLQVQLDD